MNYGTTTIDHIRLRCHICEETGCWLWRGAMSKNQPRIFATNYSKALDGSVKTTQTGQRAVWQAHNGRAIPKGWRVWRTCKHSHSEQCLNPEHTSCAPAAAHGARQSRSGHLKGRINRIVANRATGRARSKLQDPALRALIVNSEETGNALVRATGVGRTTISKLRKHGLPCFQAVGGVFGGLLSGVQS